jgi:hypothetical protein
MLARSTVEPLPAFGGTWAGVAGDVRRNGQRAQALFRSSLARRASELLARVCRRSATRSRPRHRGGARARRRLGRRPRRGDRRPADVAHDGMARVDRNVRVSPPEFTQGARPQVAINEAIESRRPSAARPAGLRERDLDSVAAPGGSSVAQTALCAWPLTLDGLTPWSGSTSPRSWGGECRCRAGRPARLAASELTRQVKRARERRGGARADGDARRPPMAALPRPAPGAQPADAPL